MPTDPDDYAATNAALVDARVKIILFAEWRAQIEQDHLTTAGLIRVRRILDGGAFLPGAEVDALKLLVAEQLAFRRDIPVEDLPGHPLSGGVPDPGDFS
jgi:hypothetical protein